MERLPVAMERLPVAQEGGILVACALIMTVISIIFMLMSLAPVLVPLCFAVFFAFLVEPLLTFIVFLPENLVDALRALSGAMRLHREVSGGGALLFGGGALPQRPDLEAPALGVEVANSAGDRHRLVNCLQATWDVISIILCVLTLLAIMVAVVLGIYETLDRFDWSKYSTSPQMTEAHFLLDRLGVTNSSLEELAQRYQGQIGVVANSVIGIVGRIVITVLMFFFCLVAMLPRIRQRVPKLPAQEMMQKYLLCKTLTSLINALAVMLSLWALEVDLVLVFGIITFLFNFIPNVGSLLAIMAPVPLVFLTPGKTIRDAIIVAVVPWVLHNTLICTMEPQLMQAGLKLHPLTVVVSLTFWGAVWGASGMVLAVPITCGLRLWVQGVDHQHARRVSDLLENPFLAR